MEHGMGQGTNPDVQHAHRVGQKRLAQGCENFPPSFARILQSKAHEPLPHIHILKEEKRRKLQNISVCGKQADADDRDCGNRDGITT